MSLGDGPLCTKCAERTVPYAQNVQKEPSPMHTKYVKEM